MSFFSVLLSTLFFQPGTSIVDGYCSQLSTKPGDSVVLYLNASVQQSSYSLRLYDLNGTVVYEAKADVFPQVANKNKPWENGYQYKPTIKIKTPKLKSGVYVWEGDIPFVVKATNPKIVVLYSSNTEAAYGNAGGKSLYGFNSTEGKMASKVSFHRPIALPKHSTEFLRWFPQQGFTDVGYITDRDMDNYAEIQKAQLLIIPGHNEYWTLQARKNFDRFVAEGKDALILSGNTMWWQVRYEGDKLVCYRDEELDPIKDKKLKTINWNKPQLGYPILGSIGVDFSLAGFGLKEDKGWNGYRIVDARSPLLQGTGLKDGDVIPLPSDEYDGTLVRGFSASFKPIPNKSALGFEKLQIVGYDSSFRLGEQLMATWIVMKKTKLSGTIINTASTDWCSYRGMSSLTIQKITVNMVQRLLRREDVFAPEEQTTVAY